MVARLFFLKEAVLRLRYHFQCNFTWIATAASIKREEAVLQRNQQMHRGGAETLRANQLSTCKKNSSGPMNIMPNSNFRQATMETA